MQIYYFFAYHFAQLSKEKFTVFFDATNQKTYVPLQNIEKKLILLSITLIPLSLNYKTVYLLSYHDKQSTKTQPQPIGSIPEKTYAGIYQS